MKKVLTLCFVAVSSLFIASNVQAQVKIGFFDEQAILALMPGIQKVDTLLQMYAIDSLEPQKEQLLEDLKKVDSSLKDTSKLTESLKQILRREAQSLYGKLQNWQQYQTQMLQQKQDELLYSYRQRVYAVLQDVIKEQKYTHVFKPNEVIYADKSDDIALRVLAGLRIPLPKEVSEAIKNAGIVVGSGPSSVPKPAAPVGTKPSTPAKPKAGGKG